MEKYYNKCGIYFLRDVARRVGVKSPTTKCKEQLIKEICLIEKGLQRPYVKTGKQGRPVINKVFTSENYNNLHKLNFILKQKNNVYKKGYNFVLFSKPKKILENNTINNLLNEILQNIVSLNSNLFNLISHIKEIV